MRVRFTKYGKPEVVLYGAISAIAMIGVMILAFAYTRWNVASLISIPFICLFVWVLSFFRDPRRVAPRGEHRLVAPADGIIFDIGEVDEPDYLGERAIRIGIFLSVFDCHVNRIPCSGTVERLKHKRGAFFSALKAKECSKRNESNFIGIANAAETDTRIGVKQIAGQIARRIVCDLKEGAEVTRGQAFGMIKFGSRAEVFIPTSANFKLKVKLKDHVRAGRTVIGTLEPLEEPESEDE